MLSCENIIYRYPAGADALCDVSFSIGEGESVGLIGGNGAGKSTLLNLLTGLIMPATGNLTFDQMPMNRQNLSSIRRKIGMVFQNPDDQLFMPTVYDDVAFGLFNQGMSHKQVEERALQALSLLGIAQLKDRPPYRLSGGEKRSAAIATVIAMEPKLLLFDEPTAFLDPRAKRSFIGLLPTLPGAKLIATHDLSLVEALCSRVLVLQKGRLLYDGVPLAILHDDAFLENAGL